MRESRAPKSGKRVWALTGDCGEREGRCQRRKGRSGERRARRRREGLERGEREAGEGTALVATRRGGQTAREGVTMKARRQGRAGGRVSSLVDHGRGRCHSMLATRDSRHARRRPRQQAHTLILCFSSVCKIYTLVYCCLRSSLSVTDAGAVAYRYSCLTLRTFSIGVRYER